MKKTVPAAFFIPVVLSLFFSCTTLQSREEKAVDLYNKANIYREEGNYGKAVQLYINALELYPEFSAAEYNLALVYSESDDYDKAAEVLEHLYDKFPDSVLILRGLGWVYNKSGKYNVSVDFYRKALNVSPGSITLLSELADIYIQLEENEKALPLLEQGAEISESTDIEILLAETYYKSGSVKKAYLEVQKILINNPKLPAAVLYAAEYSERLELYSNALKYRKDYSALGKGSKAENLFEISRIELIYTGNYQEGLEYLEKALNEGFPDTEMLNKLVKSSKPAVKSAVRDLINTYKTNRETENTDLEENTESQPSGNS